MSPATKSPAPALAHEPCGEAAPACTAAAEASRIDLATHLDIEPDQIEPLTDSSDKRILAATIAALACHASDMKSRLPERGLKDVETCVRIEAASQLLLLEPVEDKRIYELSLYDNNPDVAC